MLESFMNIPSLLRTRSVYSDILQMSRISYPFTVVSSCLSDPSVYSLLNIILLLITDEGFTMYVPEGL